MIATVDPGQILILEKGEKYVRLGNGHTILALDPSSSRTGYALLTEQETLREAGLLKPGKTTDPAAERIGAMCLDLAELLAALAPDVIVIEWTSGHVGRKRHRGGGAGLAVYGIAIGALWQVARHYAAPAGARVEIVAENDWTDGVPKPDRIGNIARLYPAYNPARDTGGDAADAIGLARWWIRRHRLKLV